MIAPAYISFVRDRRGRPWPVRPLTVDQALALQRLADAATPELDRELRRLLQPNLPTRPAAELAGCSSATLAAFLRFLLPPAANPATADAMPPVVDLRLVCAVVMKHFSAYTFDRLRKRPLSELLDLYRLALTVQAEETLQLGLAVQAALSGSLAPLRRQCRRRQSASLCPPPSFAAADPERLADARRIAAEIAASAASARPLYVLNPQSIM